MIIARTLRACHVDSSGIYWVFQTTAEDGDDDHDISDQQQDDSNDNDDKT